MEPLKNAYSPAFIGRLSQTIKAVLPAFSESGFCERIFDKGWEARELKQRMRHIATALHHHLPGTYHQQVECIREMVAQLQSKGEKGGFEYLFFPDFLEQYGTHDAPTSLKAMEWLTQFVSCEFAVRPLLLQHQELVMAQMLAWSRHPHPHVRRFSSEGCRPRLPWAVAIPALKKDPSPVLPILENLKADESLFVRKSVANNLNDIAKDHPDAVAEVAKKWKGVSAETDWIIRHGCRTLLKKAHPATYHLFGLDAEASCHVSGLKLSTASLKIGERLRFSFALTVGATQPVKLRLEYAVYYRKWGGEWSRKIFQLAERTFLPGTVTPFEKEQRFQDFTTRKHHPGRHKLAVVVNGKEMAEKAFHLLA